MASTLKLNKVVYPTVREYFANKTVFVTGGTGFVGKLLVEKLLYSCPEVSKIYMLMRPTKNMDVHQRLSQMLTLPVFYRLKDKPEQLAKIHPVHGDITVPKMMVNAADIESVVKNTEVVIHGAATVNFDESVSDAVMENLQAVEYMVKLCKKMENLESMVHVSTCYSNANRITLQEKVYDTNIEPERVLELHRTMTRDKLNGMKQLLLEDHPNTYTYTKGLAEKYLEKNKGDLPLSIVRPSIVVGAWRDPLPGWVDSYSSVSGPTVFIGNGILRVTNGIGSKRADFIPVDMVVNSIIAAAWNQGITGNKEIEIYNSANGNRSEVTWKEYLDWTCYHSRKVPYSTTKLYPNAKFSENKTAYLIRYYAYETIPFILLDLMRRLVGKKPILMKLQALTWKNVKVVEYFTFFDYKMEVRNLSRLESKMSKEDRKEFYFDSGAICWKRYFADYGLGVRRYLLKQDDSTIPECQENMKNIYWQYVTGKVMAGAIAAYLGYLLMTKCYKCVGDNHENHQHCEETMKIKKVIELN